MLMGKMVENRSLVEMRPGGLFCPAGDFYIDPWHRVERAVVTHAHTDHARPGHGSYLLAKEGLPVFRLRLGAKACFHPLAYGEAVKQRDVTVSLHPAGHMLGSAQVRIEHRGEVCVVSGDYKLQVESTCTPFEPVRCHHFITESTFGLPVYLWPPQEKVAASMNAWWRQNQEQGRTSILYGYAVGKAQRIIAALDPGLGDIYTHGAVENGVAAYREAGVKLPLTQPLGKLSKHRDVRRAMVVAVPGVHGSGWMKRFSSFSTAMVSGWMLLRGPKRNMAVDRGFPLSDHADWPGLMQAIEATGAETVWVTHGNCETVAKYLREMKGLNALALQTRFVGESPKSSDEEVSSEESSELGGHFNDGNEENVPESSGEAADQGNPSIDGLEDEIDTARL